MKKYFKKQSLTREIILWAGGILIITIILLTGYTAYRSNHTAREHIKNELDMSTRAISSEISGQIRRAHRVAQTTANSLVAVRPKNSGYELPRNAALDILKSILRDNPSVLGNYFIWKYNEWDGRAEEFLDAKGVASDSIFAPYCSRGENNSFVFEAMENTFTDPAYLEGMEIQEKTLKGTLFEPYFFSVKDTELMVITVETPIIQGKNNVLGYTGIDYRIDFIQRKLKKFKASRFNNRADISLLTKDGAYVGNTADTSVLGKNIKKLNTTDSTKLARNLKLNKAKSFRKNDTLYMQLPMTFGNRIEAAWQLRLRMPESYINRNARQTMLMQIGIGGLLLVVSIMLLLLWVNRMIQPLRQLATTAGQVARGDLTASIKVSRKDEIGRLANAFQKMIDEIRKSVNNIQQSADNVASGSSQVASSSHQIAQGASKQATSAEEVSSSMEEMKTSIEQNSENARVTNEIAENAEKGIEKGQEANRHTVEAMQQIAEQVTTINDIVDKIDLLAVNAAIEAARAGEAGRGFSVVASEVRDLSELSRKAAAKIDSLTQESVKIAENAESQLQDIAPEVAKTSNLINEINAASTEQSQTAQQVLDAVVSLNETIQENSSAAEELATSSNELKAQSKSMYEATSFFRLTKKQDDLAAKKQRLIKEFIQRIKALDTKEELEAWEETQEEQSGKEDSTQTEKDNTSTKDSSGKQDNDLNLDDDSDFERY